METPPADFVFADERMLREALLGLFSRMNGISGVLHLHGPLERGKDIVFMSVGPLKELIPSACVVKNTRISGSLDNNSSARNVWLQVEQALETPYTDATGQTQRVSKVYVITPHQITHEAIFAIEAKMHSRAGQVVFIGGADLVALFRSYWPDFLADEYAFLERYFRSIELELANRRELPQLSRLYPSAGFRDSIKNYYVATRARVAVHKYELDWLKGSVESAFDRKQFDKPLLDTQLGVIDRRFEYFNRLLQHLDAWDIAMQQSAKFQNPFARLAHLLHDSWAAGELREQNNIEGREVQTKTLADAQGVIDAVEHARTIVDGAVSTLERELQLGKNLQLTHSLAFPSARLLSRYMRAADCIDAFRGDVTARDGRLERINERMLTDDSIRGEPGLLLVVGAAGYTTRARDCRIGALEGYGPSSSRCVDWDEQGCFLQSIRASHFSSP